MPATEQTWRNQKLMHVVFGLTSIAMLVTTVWMLAADHLREWKDFQRKFQEVETWTAQSRIDEEKTAAFEAEDKELHAKLDNAKTLVPADDLIDRFVSEAEAPVDTEGTNQQLVTRATLNGYKVTAIRSAQGEMEDVRDQEADPKIRAAKLTAKRTALIDALDAVLKKAKFAEDNQQRDLKFARANLDVDKSDFSLGVDNQLSPSELAAIKTKIDHVQTQVDALTLKYQAAKTHRLALQAILAEIEAPVTVAQKALDDHNANLKRLVKAEEDRAPNWGKSFLELPIIDAFGRPLKVEQIWLPQLTLNNNFRDVARFDRCTTCHQGIDKTAAGAPSEPGYESRHEVALQLETPKQSPPPVKGEDGKQHPATTVDVYGLKLADKGLVNDNEVTIDVVWPRSAAARSGLEAGDVIRQIGDVKITDKRVATTYLLDNVSVKWGQPISIKVHRGVPQPFSSHPRLDLFVGSLSPHKMGDIGCTICHEGQGSATAFKWASHTANTPEQGNEWKRDHGWFNNHHWIYPMLPDRFNESGCLKCHHEVAELEPSERFPDPPAARLMAGYHTIRQYGCFGCHEINGFDGPNKRRGPDLRAEPNYYAAAAALLPDPALTSEQRRLAEEVIAHPELDATRKLLAESIRASLNPPANDKKAKKLSANSEKMAGLLGADDATPGQLRKVGPSLRYVGSKVDMSFLYNWVREPKDFRPSTKMPQFFGLYDHLLPEQEVDKDGKPVFTFEKGAGGEEVKHPKLVETQGLKDAKRFEPVEILSVSHYLLSASQPFEYLDKPKGVTEKPSAERGKSQFQTRGCLACHKHPDFPDGKQSQGPDLARLGSKLAGENGARWLYSWVRAPNRYHARTVMPNLFLEPIKDADGKVSDPAADITAFLLGSQGWKPKPLPAVDEKSLDDLVIMNLKATFTLRDSQRYTEHGIPRPEGADLKGDEAILVTDKPLAGNALKQKKLLYLGRRTITRLGCSGCHDIPGYEDAKSIGTGLADWGRKETSKLAFEQIVPYLERTIEHGHNATGSHGLSTKDMDPSEGFFIDAMLSHQREGFLWQKLRDPRSYDYRKTEAKDYNDRLRMPKFNFDEDRREEVMTFVLGLVAEPPAAKYIYKPDRRNKAIQQGEQLLTKFNCKGCHTIEMEQWGFDYKPYNAKDKTGFEPPPPVVDYSFLFPHFTPQQLAASKKADRRGLGHALLTGMPNPEVAEDDDGKPLYYFGPWKPVAIDGHVWMVGGNEVPVMQSSITDKRAPVGGELARMLHPIVLDQEKKTNPNAKASDAWGWVPPPLLNEGRKVQSQWLHDFLLDPYPIRPAVVLRMPRFNMSSAEASALADYFGARDNVDFPYEFDARTRTEYVSSEEARHPHRLDDALKIITDNNYCVKCHRVGDFVPQGAVSAQAPQLDRVSQRLRPDFLQKWLANPRRLLPYTGMPVNFPLDKPVDQKLFKGDSEEQLQAVVDLLLNWPSYMKDRTSIKPMIKPVAVPPATAGASNN